MSLEPQYNPQHFETKIYEFWESQNAFKPRGGKRDAFSMAVPPPNANGNLHLGHGLTLAIEDIMCRHHRLKGDSVLFVPGADHAGFETWVVYEKQLAAQGKSRFDFSREELYQQIWDYVAQNKENYRAQFRQLGASVDWDNYTFTLDPNVVKQAHATFKKLWQDKLIYRDERLVNYCTLHRTGFADIEVSYDTVKTPLYYIKYGPFTLATTRPETKFGDTGVAVHPDDTRYQEWIGKTITVEGVNGPFEVRVVADEMVDPEFGTGVVKITPAHSFDDWEVAQRHNLQPVQVINHDGTMNHHAGPFAGLPVLEARKQVVEAMDKKGLLVKTDSAYETRVGKCYKCGTVIEPMLMEQWFIDMQKLAAPAIKALKEDKIAFQPAGKRDQLITYLENIRDWNVSRQIAWGIPIPAFQNVDDPQDWIYDDRVDQEIIEVDGKTYHRDADVFDTWFSSSSWPYVTLPSDDYYPLSCMETGADILYAWVSRMVCFGLYEKGRVPFKTVYLHGLIMDPQGQKMSKSKGNVVNPIDKVLEYGSDAFRMGIIADEAPGVNRPYDESKLIGARNFCNKLWNIARYTQGVATPGAKPAVESPADHWIISHFNDMFAESQKLMDQNRFGEAYRLLYHFVWDDLADWYLEAAKTAPNGPLMAYLLESVLRVLHPFAPFITETLWQALEWQPDTVLATQEYPALLKASSKAAQEFEQVRVIASEARQIVNSLRASGVTLYYLDSSLIASNAAVIKQLARLKDVVSVDDGTGVFLSETSEKCWLDIDASAAAAFVADVSARILKQEGVIAGLEKRLANKAYVSGAPSHVVSETRASLAAAVELLTNLQRERDRFADL